METCINYTDKTAWISSDERKWINRVRKLKDERPEEVEILRQPEDNDGCIYAKLPAAWFKVQAPRILTEEQREKLRENAARLRGMS